MKVEVDMAPVNKIIKNLGAAPDGYIQMFTTETILRHMARYMPYLTGTLSSKQTFIANPHEIHVISPAAKYLYYGKRMVNAKSGKGPRFIKGVGYRWPKGATLKETEEPLNYTTTHNQLAGPYWDKRMMAAEKDVIAKEINAYIRRGKTE